MPRCPAGPSRLGSNPESAISWAATVGGVTCSQTDPARTTSGYVRGGHPLGCCRLCGRRGLAGPAELLQLP